MKPKKKITVHVDDLLAKADCEIVDVCLPNFLHCQAVTKAARSGRHVIIEKPLALNLAEAEEMIAACKKAEVRLAYPETKKVDQVDDYFGTKVADPYRWMEDLNSPAVKQWVDAENKITFQFLDKIQALIAQPDLDPESFLDLERAAPHSAELIAPLRLDCALTYRLPAGTQADYAPTKRVDRELTTDEWISILDKAREAGLLSENEYQTKLANLYQAYSKNYHTKLEEIIIKKLEG